MEFATDLRITYVIAPAASEFGTGRALAWLDAAADSQMPVDARLWLAAAPPRSAYPACLAVKAAAEQQLDAAYLRLAREQFAFERLAPESPEALLALARRVPGLDEQRFRIDLASHAILESFGADLERSATAGGGERLRTPYLSVGGGEPAAWRAAIIAAGARPAALPEPLELLREHGPRSTPEIAAACGLAGPLAPAELWPLARDWQLAVRRIGGSEIWSI
ncbi:MAG: hypothetical protein NVSMB51_20040 [Solirubrobacteraceae bacterium]